MNVCVRTGSGGSALRIELIGQRVIAATRIERVTHAQPLTSGISTVPNSVDPAGEAIVVSARHPVNGFPANPNDHPPADLGCRNPIDHAQPPRQLGGLGVRIVIRPERIPHILLADKREEADSKHRAADSDDTRAVRCAGSAARDEDDSRCFPYRLYLCLTIAAPEGGTRIGPPWPSNSMSRAVYSNTRRAT